jgi:hypothetical protein
MKKNILVIICLFCIYFITSNLGEEYSPKPDQTPTLSPQMIEDNPIGPTGPLRASIMKFSYKSFENGNLKDFWSAHCVLYASNSEYSYIALPRHAFNPAPGTEYEIFITDSRDTCKKIIVLESIISKDYDAEMLKVKRLDIPALSNRGFISSGALLGDTAIMISPYNSRGIKEKRGVFVQENSVAFDPIFIEPGDSGSLVVGRNGAVGLAFSISNGNLKIGHYAPMIEIESLYTKLIFGF